MFRRIKGIQFEGILLDCRLSNRSVGALDDNDKAELDEFVREMAALQQQQHYQQQPLSPQYAVQGASSPSAYTPLMQQACPSGYMHPSGGVYPVHPQYPPGPPSYI
ncbi:hypothetical protein EON65_07240, partial [archaeon]